MANKYKVTYTMPQTMIIEAKDLVNAGNNARHYLNGQPEVAGYPHTILRVDPAEEADLPVELERQTS